MKKIIIIKYAELNTKKDNINMFITTLKKNIEEKLTQYQTHIVSDPGRMFVMVENDEYEEVLHVLLHTFGIHEIEIGYELEDNQLDTIKKYLIELLPTLDFKTFKVDTKRSDKSYPIESLEMSKELGATVLQNKKDISVDVHHPEMMIHVEIRKEHAYLYTHTYKGLGGYPVGSLGKGLLMLSGGIDSPVAGYLAMKRGVKIEAIYYESPPHTSEEAKNKVVELARIISEYGNDVKIHVIPFTAIQEEILKNIPHEYLITIMRRMMYRIAERVCYKNRCKVIINGESIGQVASQTLTSMAAINEVVKIPVIRPVACFDKLDIIALSKQIGTYDTSILPYEDCCTIFVPDHPVINPVIKKCEEYEKCIPYEDLIKDAIYHETIIRTNHQENEFKDIL